MAWLSVMASSTLVIGKFIVGLWINSVSVISEAIHSSIDLLAAIIALYAVSKSQEPADEDHPFGHGKFENISGTVEALLIFVAAIWIMFEASKKLIHQEALSSTTPGIAILLFSTVINLIVAKFLFIVGKKSDSVALEADAQHLQSDVYTSLGVMFGLSAIFLGQKFFPNTNLNWIDPVTAFLVALMILNTAYQLTKKAARDLLDTGLPKEEISWIKDYLKNLRLTYPEILGLHRIRTRKAGAERFIDFHLVVKPDLSVSDSHKITDVVLEGITGRLAPANIIIHVEPCEFKCSANCRSGCFIDPPPKGKTTSVKNSAKISTKNSSKISSDSE